MELKEQSRPRVHDSFRQHTFDECLKSSVPTGSECKTAQEVDKNSPILQMNTLSLRYHRT